MPPSRYHQLLQQTEAARDLYHRLVLLVAGPGFGKTRLLQKLAETRAWPLLNLNLELSSQLLEFTARQRALRAAAIAGDIIDAQTGNTLLIDNIEMLFHPALRLDPLRLLQSLSRNRTLLVSWRGDATERILTYGSAGHPEYRRYERPDALIIAIPPGETWMQQPRKMPVI